MITLRKQTTFTKTLLFLLLSTTALVFSCKDDSGTSSVTNATVKAQVGGTVASADKNLQVDVPQNTFATDASVKVTINNTNDHENGVGSIYTIETDAGSFAKPVTLTFKYSEEELAKLNTSPGFLTVDFRQNGGAWQTMPNAVYDSTQKTITVTTDHFSDWSMAKSDSGFVDLYVKGDSSSFSAHEKSNIQTSRFTKDSLYMYYGDHTSTFNVSFSFVSDHQEAGPFNIGKFTIHKIGESTKWDGAWSDLKVTILANDHPGGRIVGTISGKIRKYDTAFEITQSGTVSGNFSFLIP